MSGMFYDKLSYAYHFLYVELCMSMNRVIDKLKTYCIIIIIGL